MLHLNKGCDVSVCVFACNIVCVCYTLRRGDVLLPFLVFGGKEDGEDDFFSFSSFLSIGTKVCVSCRAEENRCQENREKC